MNRSPSVVGLSIAERPEDWALAGFAIQDDGSCTIGPVRIDLLGPDAGDGVVGWTLTGIPDAAPSALDGFATASTDRPTETDVADVLIAHPNGVTAVDHIVLLTDDLDRTVDAAAQLGLAPRRSRDHAFPDGTPVRQTFFVVGPMVLEVVAPRERPDQPRPGVRSFGIALVSPDIDATAAHLGARLGPARDAVQGGRRIATLRGRGLGLSTPVAIMSPRPPRPASTTADRR